MTGCRKFEDIIVNIDAGQVSFTLPTSQRNSDKKYILYDIAVTAEQCEKDCVYWEMVRQSEPTPPLNRHVIQFPIVYGKAQANMVERIEKPVRSGQYNVVATLAVIENNQVTGSLSVHKQFDVK